MWKVVANHSSKKSKHGDAKRRVLLGVQVSDNITSDVRSKRIIGNKLKYGSTSNTHSHSSGSEETKVQCVNIFSHSNASNTIESVIGDAFEDLPLSPRQMSFVWYDLSQICTKTQSAGIKRKRWQHELDALVTSTLDVLNDCSQVELCRTALAIAKIIRFVPNDQNRRGDESSHYRMFHDLLIGNDGMKRKNEIFNAIAAAANPFLPRFNQGENWFNPQSISNLAYACAIAQVKPMFGHRSLFDCIADNISSLNKMSTFKPQNLSILVWAYAKAGVPHAGLFDKVAYEVVEYRQLNFFDPQHLSNIVWSYATAGISNSELFEKVAKELIGLSDLNAFKPQEMSNIVWAFAKAGVWSPALFHQVADDITRRDLGTFKPLDISIIVHAFVKAGVSSPALFHQVADEIARRRLGSFKPQELSNIVWAFAKAKECRPTLFHQVADDITRRDLGTFKPRDLCNILFAFATAKIRHAGLFNKMASAIIERKQELSTQDIANTLWAYATLGLVESPLFEVMAPRTKEMLGQYNSQGLSNIAWSYAVANVNAPSLFDKQFTKFVCDQMDCFTAAGLAQLYQWHLWQQKERSNPGLPPAFAQKCYNAFTSQKLNGSVLEMGAFAVVRSMRSIKVKERQRTPSGYSVDIVVQVNGKQIGIEVDGPSHFIGRVPTGNTLLKGRHVTTLDKMKLVSIPYWEWDELGKDDKKKKRYIHSKLGMRLHR